MAGQLQANFTEGLKIVYGQRVHSVTNDRAKVYNMLPEVQRPFDGKYLVEALTARYPATSGGYGPDLNALPTPDYASVTNTTIRHTFYYASVKSGWDVEALSGSDVGAFARAKALQLERALMYTVQDMERTASHDGSGVLADSVDVTGPTSANWTFTCTNYEAVRFPIGQRVWFLSGLSSDRKTNLKNATLRSVPTKGFFTVSNNVPGTSGTATITILEASPAADPPVDTDCAVKAFSIAFDVTGSTTNAGNEFMGLAGIIDNDGPPLVTNSKQGFDTDGTFQGISTTSNGWWASPTISGSSTQYLSPTLLEQLSEQMSLYSAQEMEACSFILTTPFQARKYREALIPAERYPVTDASPSLPTGTTSSTQTMKRYLTFSGIPIMPGRFLDAGLALAVNTNDIKRATLSPFSFKAEHQDFGGAPAQQQDAMAILQVYTTDRATSGRIELLKTT